MPGKRLGLISMIAAALAACGAAEDLTSVPAAAFDEATRTQLASNPLLAEWAGPNGGQPAFDRMDLAQLEAAMDAGMAASLAEIDAIASNPAKASFENTIVALEREGEPLDRAMTYYGIWQSNMSTPEFREIQNEMAPKLADYQSAITQNETLFARIKTLYDDIPRLKLTPHQTRLLQLVYDRFQLSGAELTGEKRERYAAIQKELAALQTTFSNNLLADEEGWVTYVTKGQLGGLPASVVASARAAAADLGKPGMYAITNTRSSIDPFLTYSTERALRQKVWRNFYSRGDNGDEHDNNAVITRILKLRHERANLLGFRTYADWQLQDTMAKTPAAATALMEAVWAPAVARAKEEIADMQTLANAEGARITIEPWDYRFYAEKVRRAKYDLDGEQVKPYLQLEKLRDAMFYVAGELFGFTFTPVAAGMIPVFHPDVKVWVVTDTTSGKHVGYWYLDPYARPGKRSGAWASSYRSHSTFDGLETVLSSNNSNFVKPAPGEPLLISYDDAETFFHEFGHALHALSSSVEYPSLNGGVRDYTEFHSQLLERWLLTDRVVDRFFRHYQTGEPMPKALIEKITRAATFNQGFGTVEFLGSAIMDMRYHMADPATLDPRAFEKTELARLGMPKEIPMRHRSTQFAHIFSSEGYAAGYYGYLWADVLTADAAESFRDAPGGFYDKALGRKLVDTLFTVRNAVDPNDAYRAFRGRDATRDALLRDRGFPVPSSATGTP
jgi:peptidyl-dipeptidase Dcp